METIPANTRDLVKKGLAFLVFYGLVFTMYSMPAQTAASADWVLSASVNQVDFYYKIVDCKGQTAVLLKLDNKNDYAVKVSWKEIFTTQAEDGKEGGMGPKELTLAKGVTMPADCSDITRRKNIVYPSEVDPAYVAEIKKYAFKVLAVVRLK